MYFFKDKKFSHPVGVLFFKNKIHVNWSIYDRPYMGIHMCASGVRSVMHTLGCFLLIKNFSCVASSVWPHGEAVVLILVEDVEQYSVTFSN